MINKSGKGAVLQIATVFRPIWRVLSKDPLKHGFLVIYLTIFCEAGISRNTSARGSSFFGKFFKFHIDFKNRKKNRQNFFCF